MNIEIKNRSGRVLWSGEAESLRHALELAVVARANLAGANLAGEDIPDEEVVVELAPEQLEAMDEAVERFKARRAQARVEERRLAKYDRG